LVLLTPNLPVAMNLKRGFSSKPAEQLPLLEAPSLPQDSRIECIDNLSFLSTLPDKSIQLVVTSPPYNLGKVYERRTSMESYLTSQQEVIKESVRVLADSGSICWQVGNHVYKGEVYPLDILLYPVFKELGLQLRNRIIWQFGHGLHCQKRLSGRYETILWFTKTENYIFNLDPIRIPSKYPGKKHFKGAKAGELSCNPMGKNPSDVWDIPNVKSNHCEKTEHPCQFPVELIERLVLSMTNPGDLVLDPYLGVGSTVLAAVKNHRIGLGAEISPKYATIAKERLHALREGKLVLRPMNKPVYDPSKPNGGH